MTFAQGDPPPFGECGNFICDFGESLTCPGDCTGPDPDPDPNPGGDADTPISQAIFDFRTVIAIAIPLAASLALLFFIWGLALYILRSGDIKSKEEARSKMIWGVVALFVIFSIWGIIGFLGGILGIGQGGVGAVPGVTNPLR